MEKQVLTKRDQEPTSIRVLEFYSGIGGMVVAYLSILYLFTSLIFLCFSIFIYLFIYCLVLHYRDTR